MKVNESSFLWIRSTIDMCGISERGDYFLEWWDGKRGLPKRERRSLGMGYSLRDF
jgi:hypothetical protein